MSEGIKLIITIPEDKYRRILELEQGNTDYATTVILYHAVKHGKLYLEYTKQISEKAVEELHEKVAKYCDHDVLATEDYCENTHCPNMEIVDSPERMDAIEGEIKELSERVENIERMIREDKELQLEKLQAEAEYAKFCCGMKSIWNEGMNRYAD